MKSANRQLELQRRAVRARALSATYPAAAEILELYAVVAEFQSGVFQQLGCSARPNQGAQSLRERIDVSEAVEKLRALLAGLEQHGLPVAKMQAAGAAEQCSDSVLKAFASYVHGEDGAAGLAGFCARVCVQPFGEFIAQPSDASPMMARYAAKRP